ncbi:MAG: type III pantothenate kinase [Oscillospiraceae bacterium]
MVLTIDVGNTNIVLGGFENDELIFVSRVQTNKNKMSDEYAIEFDGILRFYKCTPEMFDGAIISCVVPPLNHMLKKAISRLLNCKVMTVSPGTKTGLNIKIDNPAILGSDLVCGAVSAIGRYPLPCIIIDLGTATKFSVLDKDGNFLGVSIMPGVIISLEALSASSAQLPHIDLRESVTLIGKNSPDSMRSGIIFGTASMIEGMVERINEELGQKATVIATGGVASNIIPYCKSEIIVDENIVIYGLKEIYNKNTKK